MTNLPTSYEKGAVLLDLRGADITLTSNDDTHFKVHRHVLALASPLFEDMFRLPNESESPTEISMIESAAILDALLRYIYPLMTPKHQIADIDEAALLIETARKLQLSSAEREIMVQIEIFLAAEENPFVAWAFAIRCGAEQSRKAAMERVLSVEDFNHAEMVESGKESLRYVTGKEFYDLTQWRAAAVQQARTVLKDIPVQYANTCVQVGTARSSSIRAELRRVLLIVNPFGHFDKQLLALAHALPKTCPCRVCAAEPTAQRVVELKQMQLKTREVLNTVKSLPPYVSEAILKAE